MDDLLIDRATIVDGSGRPGFVGTVQVRAGRIASIRPDRSNPGSDERSTGETATADGVRRLEGDGLVLSPGFVDVHNHSDLSPFVDPSMASTIRQGVTTVVVGNCGSSPWPMAGANECLSMAGGDPGEVDVGFASFGDYLGRLADTGPAVNVAALVGHGAIRSQAMGSERRPPTPAELDRMRGWVAEAVSEGAVGLSTGLIYVPGIHSDTDEVVALAAASASAGGLYASHIRGEGAHLFRAVDEAIEVGRRAGLPAHVSHLKCESSTVWGRAEEILERFHGSDDVTADQYPYAAWSSDLRSLLPPWAPVDRLPSIRADAARSARLVEAIEHGEGEAFQSSVDGVGWDRIVIEASGAGGWNGLSVAEVARTLGVAPVDACLDLLQDDPATGCIGHAMDERDVRTILADPEIMVASDAIAMSPDGPLGAVPVHPRTYGTFPRVLGRYVRDGVLGLEPAIRSMTSSPAERFGLHDRGLIVVGAAADLVLFDPATIADRSEFGAPHAFPAGIEAVVVNGAVAWSSGRPLAPIERRGVVLRSS